MLCFPVPAVDGGLRVVGKNDRSFWRPSIPVRRSAAICRNRLFTVSSFIVSLFRAAAFMRFDKALAIA